MNTIYISVLTLVSLAFGLLPEAFMWFLWGIINPTTSIERLLTIAVFMVGGGSLSILFGFLALSFWVHMLDARPGKRHY